MSLVCQRRKSGLFTVESVLIPERLYRRRGRSRGNPLRGLLQHLPSAHAHGAVVHVGTQRFRGADQLPIVPGPGDHEHERAIWKRHSGICRQGCGHRRKRRCRLCADRHRDVLPVQPGAGDRGGLSSRHAGWGGQGPRRRCGDFRHDERDEHPRQVLLAHRLRAGRREHGRLCARHAHELHHGVLRHRGTRLAAQHWRPEQHDIRSSTAR